MSILQAQIEPAVHRYHLRIFKNYEIGYEAGQFGPVTRGFRLGRLSSGHAIPFLGPVGRIRAGDRGREALGFTHKSFSLTEGGHNL